MKPIIQHTWQVRSLLRGATAVVVPMKPQPSWCATPQEFENATGWWTCHEECDYRRCPYAVGDVLACKEKFATAKKAGNRQIAFAADGRWGSPSADGTFIRHGWVVGVTDKTCENWRELKGHWVGRSYFNSWRPAHHIPNLSCRLHLTVAGPPQALHYEQVSEEQCYAVTCDDFLDDFRSAYQSSHPSRPWLWWVPVEPLKEK